MIKIIYIASPLFSEMEKNYIDEVIYKIGKKLHLNTECFYVPHQNNKEIYESNIYNKNIEYLNHCDIMIAILDGNDVDSGTAFEIGYFEVQNKIVLGLLTDTRSYDEDDKFNLKLNTMIFGSLQNGNFVFDNIDDLIEVLYDVLMEN